MNNINVELAKRLLVSASMKNFVTYYVGFISNPNLAYIIEQEQRKISKSSAFTIEVKGKKIFELGYEKWALEKISKSKRADKNIVSLASKLLDDSK